MPIKKKKAPAAKKIPVKKVKQEKKPKEGISFPIVGTANGDADICYQGILL